jgi:hypothetical protein
VGDDVGDRLADDFTGWQELVSEGVPEDVAAAWAATPRVSPELALTLHRAGVTPAEFQMWADAGLAPSPAILAWADAGWSIPDAIGWARALGMGPSEARRLVSLGFSSRAWFGWLRCGLDPEAVPECWRDTEPASAMRSDELLAERCATQGDEIARAWAARSGWPGLLRLLAHDEDERVRAIVAAADRLDGEVIEALLARPSARVCYVLATNQAAPRAARERARALLQAGVPTDDHWGADQQMGLLPADMLSHTGELVALVLERTWADLDDPLSGPATVESNKC